jgi:hypothetical protein
VEVTVLKKLLLAFRKELLREFGPVRLSFPLLENVQKIDEIVERFDPSGHLPVGIAFDWKRSAEDLKQSDRKAIPGGKIRIIGLKLSTEIL